jgi:predicted nucleic acid-binding protein
MPPTYTVRAAVVDIRADAPRASDRFFVDTNVWAWEHYFRSGVTAAGAPIPQKAEYTAYLLLTRDAGAARCHTVLSLAELARLIEANELEGYSIGVGRLTLKEYRHNVPAERARVVSEIASVRADVEADPDLLPSPFDAATAASAFARLASEPLDANDALHLEAMLASGVTQILSDDGDFSAAAGVELFTANPRVIAAASAQGRLLAR